MDRPPPHAEECELCLLGCMLLDPRVGPKVLELVPDGTAFYNEHLGAVYDIVLDLWRRNGAADKVLLRRAIDDRGLSEQFSDRHLADIAESVPTPTNAEYYAAEVRRKHRLRKVREAGLQAVADAHRPGVQTDEDVEELIARAGERMARAGCATREARGFRPVAIGDLIGMYPSMREPVVEGLLRAGEVMNVVAPPKVGKSWLVQELGLCVAAGSPWLGHATQAGRVLLIDGELHQNTIAQRLATLRGACGLEHALDLDVWSVRGQRLTVRDIADQLAAVPAGRYRLVILDALYRFLPRDGEENRNETMIEIYNDLDALASRTRSAIVVVHHTTKGSQSDKAVTDVGSGAGAQSRAADTHLVIRPHEVEDAAVVQAVVRSWPNHQPLVIRWKNPGWEIDREGLEPAALRSSRKRAATDAKPSASTPSKKEWTPEEFAAVALDGTPRLNDDVLGRARKVDKPMFRTTCIAMLRLCVDQKLAVEVRKGKLPLRYALVARPGGQR